MFSRKRYENEFLFSVVLSIQNTRKYIEKSIESIINQTLAFEENIQLILLTSETTEDIESYLSECNEKYPQNISIVSNKDLESDNYSQISSTICGQYVIFLEMGDYLSKNMFEKVNLFLNTNHDVNVISVPMYFISNNENKKEINKEFEVIPKEGAVINLENNTDYVQKSFFSTIISNDLLNQFCVSNEYSENIDSTILINKILLNENKIGLLNTPKYFKSDKFITNEDISPVEFEKRFFISNTEKLLNLINYSKENYGKIPIFVQNMILFKLSDIIQNNYEFLDNDDVESFFNSLQNVLNNIDLQNILNNGNLQQSIKSFLIYLKNGKQSNIESFNKQLLLKSNDYQIDKLNYHPIYIIYKQFENNVLTVRGMLNSHFNSENLSFEAEMKDNSGELKTFEGLVYDLNSPNSNNISYLNMDWEFKNIFEVNISLGDASEKNIIFKVKYNDSNYSFEYLPNIKYAYKSGITEEKNKIYHESKLITFTEKDIEIKRGFRFSIIMAIYNTGHYLNQTIDSVISQTLDFEENVQLILVNDGSIDNSLEICKEYQQQYPKNIVVIDQENGGQSSARNHGLEYAIGEYVNFLDSDDYLSENALEEVNSFLEEYSEKTDLVALPIVPFGRYSHNHMLHYKFEKTRLIDLNKEPNNPHLHVSSSFIKREALGDIRFDTRLISSEDAQVVNQVLLFKRTLGVISDASYFYRKRFDESSTIDTMTFKKEYYTDRLKHHFLKLINQCVDSEGKVPKFIQHVLAYDIQWLIKETETLDMFDNDIERKEFLYYIKKILSSFDDDVILNNRNISDYSLKTFCYYLKKQDKHFELTNDNVILKIGDKKIDDLACHLLWIDLVKIQDGFLYISGFFNSLIDYDKTSIVAIKENEDESVEYYPGKQVYYTSRKDRKFLDTTWQFKKNFDIKIPLDNSFNSKIKIIANFHKNGDNTDFRRNNLKPIGLDINFNKHSKLSKTSNFMVKEPYMLIYEDKTFNIEPYSYKKFYNLDKEFRNKIKEEKPYGYEEAIKVRRLYTYLYPIVSRIKRNKDIYLFIDRKEIADDNSMHLFRYASNIKDDVKKYLVVSNKSRNYKLLSRIGNVINYNSLKHKLVYLFADKIISTHPYESELNPFFEYGNDRRELFNGLNTSNTYFLQHGVTLGNISDWMSKCDKDLSLIVTVSDREKESFSVEGYNFDSNIIETLGFPRYDNLKNDSNKKQLLIIPTWRKFLSGQKELFLHSEYYKKINSLLNNKKLLSYAKENGYKIVFKGHPELEKPFNEEGEKFIDFINIPEQITLSTRDSYQKLFNDSSILVTDYSSVFFDFAYLKKPVIYYQPDEDYHYDESYFDFETMGFGDVIRDEDDLIGKINEFMHNGSQMDDKYRERVDNFFKYTDQNNCQRVYNWIKEH